MGVGGGRFCLVGVIHTTHTDRLGTSQGRHQTPSPHHTTPLTQGVEPPSTGRIFGHTHTSLTQVGTTPPPESQLMVDVAWFWTCTTFLLLLVHQTLTAHTLTACTHASALFFTALHSLHLLFLSLGCTVRALLVTKCAWVFTGWIHFCTTSHFHTCTPATCPTPSRFPFPGHLPLRTGQMAHHTFSCLPLTDCQVLTPLPPALHHMEDTTNLNMVDSWWTFMEQDKTPLYLLPLFRLGGLTDFFSLCRVDGLILHPVFLTPSHL